MQSPWAQDDSVVSLEISLDSNSDEGVVCRVSQFGASREVASRVATWAARHGARYERIDPAPADGASPRAEMGYLITHLGLQPPDDAPLRGPVAETLERLFVRYREAGESVYRERVIIDLDLELALSR